MDTIPAEILVRILGCIDPIYDALIRYSRVCTTWRDVIEHAPALWNHIHVISVWITSPENSMLKHCLVRFKPFIRCLRVCDYHNDVFLDVTMRELVCELPSLRCLDVPLFQWDPNFLESFQSAECLQELNLYGFGNSDMKLWPSLIHDPHPPYLLSQEHFQILQRRFRSLKTLKISLNMLDLSQLDLMTFLDTLKPSNIQVTVFARSYSGPSFHFIGVNGLRHLLSSVHASAITALQLHDVGIGHKETRLMLKNLPALRRLRLVFDSDRMCRNPYQFLQSDTLRVLVMDGLPAVHIKYLRCCMPSLVILKLSRCPLVISATISSPVLGTLHITDLPKLRDFHVDSTRLKEFKISKCHAMSNDARLVKFLEKHPQITRLKLFVNVERLRLQGACCNSLSLLHINVLCMDSFSYFKIDCPTLKSFTFRGAMGQETHGQEQRSRSLIMNADILDDVHIHSPGVSTLVVHCNRIRSLNINLDGSTWDEESPELDLHLISETVCLLIACSCRFSRFRVDCRYVTVVRLQTCTFAGPLQLYSKYIFGLVVRECQDIAELHVQTTSLNTREFSLLECEKLTNVTYDVIVQDKETAFGEGNFFTPRPQALEASWRPDKDNQGTAKPSPPSLLAAQRSPHLKRLRLERHLEQVTVHNCASFWLSDRPFQERLVKGQLADGKELGTNLTVKDQGP